MEKIYIYGAGNTGLHAYEWLNKNFEVVGFIDSDDDKVGKTLNGIPVYSPDILYSNELARSVYIASIYHKEILKKLFAMKIQKNIYIYIMCQRRR